MLLIIDNYDSFTYNLAQYFSHIGAPVSVVRNDSLEVGDIEKLSPSALVISPGPGGPEKSGISGAAILQYAGRLPILGVCLGHQTIGHVFGGAVIRAREVMHGKTSPVYHDGKGLFRDIPSPFTVVRYHSLAVEKKSLPDCLEVSAWGEDGEIMGLRHREYGIDGVQFHPESILTQHGLKLLHNFLVTSRLTGNLREVV